MRITVRTAVCYTFVKRPEKKAKNPKKIEQVLEKAKSVPFAAGDPQSDVNVSLGMASIRKVTL